MALTVDQLRRVARLAGIHLIGGLRKAKVVERLLQSGMSLTLPSSQPKRPVRRRIRILGPPKRPEKPEPGPEPAPEPPPAPSWDLPPGYGESSVTLMARDPYWAFAYWEIPPQHIRLLCETYSQSTYAVVLRFYDIWGIEFNGSNAHRSFDLEVSDAMGSWNIPFWTPQGAYCAEIGLRFPNGLFVAAARSNAITLPPDTPSSSTTETWMEVPWEVETGLPPEPRVQAIVPAVPAPVGEYESRPHPGDRTDRPYMAESMAREFPYREPEPSQRNP